MIFILTFHMKILKSTTSCGEHSSSNHARISSRNRIKVTVKVAYNMETVKYLILHAILKLII